MRDNFTVMGKTYDWDSSNSIGREAVAAVMELLQSPVAHKQFFKTESLISVEDDPGFRKREIDLLWIAPVNGIADEMTIEVKGDRNFHTGNFFLETVSDVARNARGCFLTSEADWFFYYYVDVKILFCLPLNLTRHWFSQNVHRFKERTTSSRRGERAWETKGCLVPIKTLVEELECIPCFKLREETWLKVKIF